MIQPVSYAAAENGEIVDMLRDLGIPIGDPDTALSVLLECALRGEQRVARGTHGGYHFTEGRGHRLTVELRKFRLGVEQIDVAWPAFHEQPDHRFRRRLMMRWLGRERI